MLTVAKALEQLFDVTSPLASEKLDLGEAAGRVLATTLTAVRSQPPFNSSAMDGYALDGASAMAGSVFDIIGQSAAGHRFQGKVKRGQAVRIFTGAPIPDGTNRVVVQEDVVCAGNHITLGDRVDEKSYIRAKGADFAAGQSFEAPRLLRPVDLALLAAMNHPQVDVYRRPVVSIVATGDELVLPGHDPGQDQIIASNTFGLQAMARISGALVRPPALARDNLKSLDAAFSAADGADLLVTIGGVSVGDHDLVAKAAQNRGLEKVFHKVAMRPGKPLLAGKLGKTILLGLPGNPVSAFICGKIFMVPILRAMQGLPAKALTRHYAPLVCDLAENGDREHYMRAVVNADGQICPMKRQDSALLSVLADANALLVRQPNDTPRTSGHSVQFIPL